MNTKALKEQLNTDQIITLLESLGAELREERNDHLIFTSICHHLNANEHKAKLYYYTNTHSFFCFSCSQSFDIFSLIEEVWNLRDIEFYFGDIVNFITSTLGISQSDFNPKQNLSWRDDLRLFTATKSMAKHAQIYPLSDLNRFVDKLPYEWIKEGISVDTMRKYHIGYYPLLDCTTIPVFDKEGELLGIRGRFWREEDIELGKYRPIWTLERDYKLPTSNLLYGLYQNQETIKATHEVKLFEGEKSVMQMEGILEQNNAVAMFGCNLSKMQLQQLIELEVERYVICLDKWGSEDDKARWRKDVDKIVKMCKPYGEVVVVEDNGILDWKDSPSDKGKEIWEELYKNSLDKTSPKTI